MQDSRQRCVQFVFLVGDHTPLPVPLRRYWAILGDSALVCSFPSVTPSAPCRRARIAPGAAIETAVSRFAWFDSGCTSCVSPGGLRTKSLYFPREGGPRILRSILGLCMARGTQEMWYFWEMKSCSSSSPPQRVSSTSDMKMMENRALG